MSGASARLIANLWQSPRCSMLREHRFEVEAMAREIKEVSCRESGVDCDFVVRATSLQEIVEIAAIHAKNVHGMLGFGEELYMKMRSLVRTVVVE